MAGSVAASVAGTAAAGLLLSWLRERSGSLAAPVLLHLSANCGAALAARAAAGIHPPKLGAGVSVMQPCAAAQEQQYRAAPYRPGARRYRSR